MKRISEQSGQGLMELTVAFTVIAFGLMGSFALVVNSLKASTDVTGRMIGSHLAWEGIEVVRNIRDSNWLKGLAWDTSLSSGDTTAIPVFNESNGSWTLNFVPNAFSEASTFVYRNNGVYLQDVVTPPGTVTTYQRLITIDSSGGAFVKKITSEARWNISGNNYVVVAEGYIYDWR